MCSGAKRAISGNAVGSQHFNRQTSAAAAKIANRECVAMWVSWAGELQAGGGSDSPLAGDVLLFRDSLITKHLANPHPLGEPPLRTRIPQNTAEPCSHSSSLVLAGGLRPDYRAPSGTPVFDIKTSQSVCLQRRFRPLPPPAFPKPASGEHGLKSLGFPPRSPIAA
jgi:hypothetical protein